ncbi:MAG: GDSL-type esterase/lipase family protein [Tannerella sp.]|jgi:lysophospholipase L1-like esterase|nr:GDSL-type esterase/lipase family protein [Tannerella sp.]
MKKTVSLSLTLLFVACQLFGQTLVRKFYIDFGQDNPAEGRHVTGVDGSGNQWNNVIAPNGSPSTLGAGPTVQLKSSTGQSTLYTLEVARAINSNGGSNGGLSTPDPVLLGDLAVASATEDYFYLESGKGLFLFKNLDVDRAYRFYIYGCRTALGNRRGVVYSLSGRNGSHGSQLNTGTGIGDGGYDGNNNNVWESSPVFPAANGEIMLELGRLFSDQMAYISALKMEEYDGYALPEAEREIFIDFGMNNSGVDGSPTVSPDVNDHYWNNLGPAAGVDGPTDKVAAGTNISLVAADNSATGYALETGSVMEWNGVRNGGLGGPDSPNEPNAALLGDLAVKTATHDYLFINSDATAVLHFKNLNREKQYRFNIFGSRKDDGNEGRIGRIEIAGANAITGIHQMGGAGIGANGENYNNKNIFISDPMRPAADGRITLTMTRWLGMAHINCIRLEELDGGELSDLTAISISGGNAISACGGSLQLTATAIPAGALLPLITWSVDDDSIAIITSTGRLYAKANGRVTVTATATETIESSTAFIDTKEITISNQNIGDYSLTVMGSSVPRGWGAEPQEENGYAWLWTKYLEQSAAHPWTTNNISIPGNTTTDVTNRWDADLLPSCSRYVYYGLSLGNEGIHDRGQAAFNSWRDNMLALIERARSHGKIPIVGNNYPRGDFNSSDYNYVKQLNLLIHEWDVPSVNLLGAIDNGAGRWASSYVADDAHPNTAGHAELYSAIVPSLLDALAAGKPQPVRTDTTFLSLEKADGQVKSIAVTPESGIHSFTLTFSFRTASTGTIASLVKDQSISLKIAADGKLVCENSIQPRIKLSSSAAVNDGQWHQASLTHYYARGSVLLYVDGVSAGSVALSLAPEHFYLNSVDDPLQAVDFRELFLHRSAMCTEEIQALHGGKMMKSSLEIYAPLDGSAGTETEMLENRAQSLNTVRVAVSDATSLPVADALPGLRVHPNPAGDVLFIEGVRMENDPLFLIYNMQGVAVKRVEAKAAGSVKISLSDLPAGVYMLRNGGKEVKILRTKS